MTRTYYRIGIDVGGTNTDAVILEETGNGASGGDSVVAWSKVATSADVTSGIKAALKNVLEKSQLSAERIQYVSIGTTHFLNAVIEADARRLSKVGVIRLAGPYTKKCPPFLDFPPHLREIIEGYTAIIDGGLEIDGKEICPIRDDQLEECCNEFRSKNVRDIVVVGVFSPLATSGSQEDYAKKAVLSRLGANAVNVVCSKDVANIGLLERENAAILNASIHSFAKRTIAAYHSALRALGLKCPLYLTQLDGTLIDADIATRIPIRTFSNGPTNSMRGAAFLSGLDRQRQQKSTIVVDVGGTSTDVGVLLPSGFPRTAAAYTEVGGVRTNFTMPDIHSIGLGGGSLVRFDPNGTRASVGPDSVGYAITSRALIFGGTDLTASDIAVAVGLTRNFGNNTSVDQLKREEVEAGEAAIRRVLESAIDKMKTDAEDIDVLLVGGGSVIVPDNLRGVKKVFRPPHYGVANAVGAAIARVSGTVDRVEVPGKRDMKDIVEECKRDAVDAAVEAGAKRETVFIAEVSVIQLPYVANDASRIIVRTIGELDPEKLKVSREASSVIDEPIGDGGETGSSIADRPVSSSAPVRAVDAADLVDPTEYRPCVSKDGVWTMSETDLEWISEGCGILGCGGGGATYPSFVAVRHLLQEGHKIRIVDFTYFSDKTNNNNDGWVISTGFMGSPSVSTERIPSNEEVATATRYLSEYLKAERPAGIISTEIGGKNGLEPMLLAAKSEYDLPIVDGDLMGRAYPCLDQVMPCLAKDNALTPAATADGQGNCMIIPTTRDNRAVEDIFRAACTALGSSVALTLSPMRTNELEDLAICRSTSLAWRIGRAVASCRRAKNLKHIADAITEVQGGRLLFVGKIIDVSREVKGGFTHGQITTAPLTKEEEEGPSEGIINTDDKMLIPFQNENLAAFSASKDGALHTVCTVPDLIAVLDSQNGSSIGTQDYRYGLRVTVVGLACDPRWTTVRGLEVGGPKAFGLMNAYNPVGQYREVQSVIEEFRPT